MHVVSASRRTDIPAFHAQWFANRLREGWVRVRSPFGGGVHEVSLRADDVIAIVFWTKNAAPLMPLLDEVLASGHCFTFLYTINNYPSIIEPRVPSLDHSLRVVQTLVERYSRSSIRWRYDTIVLTDQLNPRWHAANFVTLCERLAPYTNECIFSFCDYYRKTIRNMERRVPSHARPTETECRELAEELAEIAARNSIKLLSCSHEFLVSARIGSARCIDPEFLAGVVDSAKRKQALSALKRAPTRKECHCAASRDIGAYDTCGHGCVYCYANAEPERAANNLALIGPDSPTLDPASVVVGGRP